jgi:hypothetical protein
MAYRPSESLWNGTVMLAGTPGLGGGISQCLPCPRESANSAALAALPARQVLGIAEDKQISKA